MLKGDPKLKISLRNWFLSCHEDPIWQHIMTKNMSPKKGPREILRAFCNTYCTLWSHPWPESLHWTLGKPASCIYFWSVGSVWRLKCLWSDFSVQSWHWLATFGLLLLRLTVLVSIILAVCSITIFFYWLYIILLPARQCCGTITIYCGSVSSLGKVSVPFPPVPDPNPDPDQDHTWTVFQKNVYKILPFDC